MPREYIYNLPQDSHHIFFTRREWNHGEALKLRRHPYCIAKIPKVQLHEEIHAKILSVPVPSDNLIRGALVQLEFLEKYGGIHEYDSAEKRIRVLLSFFRCIAEPTAEALEKQLEIVRRFYSEPL